MRRIQSTELVPMYVRSRTSKTRSVCVGVITSCIPVLCLQLAVVRRLQRYMVDREPNRPSLFHRASLWWCVLRRYCYYALLLRRTTHLFISATPKSTLQTSSSWPWSGFRPAAPVDPCASRHALEPSGPALRTYPMPISRGKSRGCAAYDPE